MNHYAGQYHQSNKENTPPRNNNKIFFIKQSIAIVFYCLFCWFCAYRILRGWGDQPAFQKTAIIFIFLGFLCSSKKTFWPIVFPLTLLAMVYNPIAKIYGQPDYQSLISAFSTDWSESREFLSLIPIFIYFKSTWVVILGLFAYKTSQFFTLQPWKNKSIVVCSIAGLVLCSHPTQFFSNFSTGWSLSREDIAAINAFKGKSTWGQSSLTKRENKDFVLIIGESARRDYFHIYGYPINNTPFLSSSAATIVNGLTAGNTFTVGSLRLMLTQANTANWMPNYDRNIIDLANSAGIDTIWLSNQGFIGQHDTPISAIATSARVFRFPTKHSYESVTLSDFRLLPLLETFLTEDRAGPRLFVLHTTGSHPDACRRILDVSHPYKAVDPKYDYMACYITSIKKTDEFIARVVSVLRKHEQKTGRNFSVIYFADHGLATISLGNEKILFNNSKTSIFSYDIPLVKIDSSNIQPTRQDAKKSGLHFTDGIAHWLGIKNPNLVPYDLFDGKSDTTDYGLKDRLQARHPIQDPPIVPILQ